MLHSFQQEFDYFLIIGNLLNWCLLGILTVQVYLYYLAFPRDRRWIKAVVYITYILETAQTFLLTRDLMAFVNVTNPRVVTKSGHLYHVDKVPQFSTIVIPSVDGLVALLSQGLYSHRIQVITKSTIITWIIRSLAVVQCGAAIFNSLFWLTVNQHTAKIALPGNSVWVPGFVSMTIWITGSAVCDVVITITMVWALSRAKKTTNRTYAAIQGLIRLIIETGIATATVAVVSAISKYYTHSIGNVYVDIQLFLSKLYANAILALLNNRISIADGRNALPDTITVNISSAMFTSAADYQLSRSQQQMGGQESEELSTQIDERSLKLEASPDITTVGS
ncbi:hypothetical protein AX17_004662 [Amanita inopinata Kibby_2008]|nr:hypothetical protein AX17_004662 [Amanita inopinata Kibby_2008]